MNAAIDLTKFKRYFEADKFKELHLDKPTPKWLHQDTPFESNEWKCLCPNGKYENIKFDQPIGINKSLVEDDALLKTAKWILVLVRQSMIVTNKTVTSGATQNKVLGGFIRLVRFLSHMKIRHLRSVNQELINQFIQELTLAETDLERNIKAIKDILVEAKSNPDLYMTTGRQSTLNIALIANKVGLPIRAIRSPGTLSSALIDTFIYENKIYVKKSIRDNIKLRYEGGELREEAEYLNRDSIRKAGDHLNHIFRAITTFSDLFPTQHVFEQDYTRNGIDIKKLASKQGIQGKRTRDIPQPVFFKLMDRAIRWVVNYSESLIDLNERTSLKAEEFRETLIAKGTGTKDSQEHYIARQVRQWLCTELTDLENLPASPYPVTAYRKIDDKSGYNSQSIPHSVVCQIREMREKKHTYTEIGKVTGVGKSSISRLVNQKRADEIGGIALNQAVYHFLPTACLLVIYAFTARREIEVDSLKAGCCDSTVNGPVIRMYSAKYFQGYSDFPTTKLVVKAVKILERLSAEERARTGDDSLLDNIPSLFSSNNSQTNCSSLMNSFAEYCGVEKVNNKPWLFSEHQFRRFFAMMYYYKYPDAELSVLSWHLRHTDFDVTVTYLTDSDDQLAMSEVGLEFSKDVSVSNEYKGPIKTELKDLIDSFEAQQPKRVSKMTQDISKNGIVIHLVPDGICFGLTDAIKDRSKCLTSGAVQLSSAIRDSCRGCKNLLTHTQEMSANSFDEIVITSQSPMLNAAKKGNEYA